MGLLSNGSSDGTIVHPHRRQGPGKHTFSPHPRRGRELDAVGIEESKQGVVTMVVPAPDRRSAELDCESKAKQNFHLQ